MNNIIINIVIYLINKKTMNNKLKLNMIIFKDNSEYFSIWDCIEMYRDDVDKILYREITDEKIREYVNKSSDEIRKAVNKWLL